MRMRSECVPCLLRRTIYESLLVNERFAERAVQKALKILAQEYSNRANSVKVATKIHREVYQILGSEDPYKELKERSNRVASKLVGKALDKIKNSNDKFESAALCSVIGNVLDFGIAQDYGAPEKLFDEFDFFWNSGFGINDIAKAKKYLQNGNEIVFLPDNCGEIIFDKLLCEQLKKFGIHLTIIVKEKPMLTDATIKEIEELKFDEVVDDVLLSTNAVGIDFNEISGEVKKRIKESDLIICKGMGLYEAFCETNYKPILYLLRTKCAPVAQDMGVSKGINVAKLYE
ncbi:MAG: ARMT1-like domain-containing protein [Candidatus Thermoplasmatota archaeon]|nr:ARMT1-like domain-containing protein [Candidatus Thermoplasmatota archaeon]